RLANWHAADELHRRQRCAERGGGEAARARGRTATVRAAARSRRRSVHARAVAGPAVLEAVEHSLFQRLHVEVTIDESVYTELVMLQQLPDEHVVLEVLIAGAIAPLRLRSPAGELRKTRSFAASALLMKTLTVGRAA